MMTHFGVVVLYNTNYIIFFLIDQSAFCLLDSLNNCTKSKYFKNVYFKNDIQVNINEIKHQSKIIKFNYYK